MKPTEFVAELEKRDVIIGNVLVLIMNALYVKGILMSLVKGAISSNS